MGDLAYSKLNLALKTGVSWLCGPHPSDWLPGMEVRTVTRLPPASSLVSLGRLTFSPFSDIRRSIAPQLGAMLQTDLRSSSVFTPSGFLFLTSIRRADCWWPTQKPAGRQARASLVALGVHGDQLLLASCLESLEVCFGAKM